MEITPCGLVGQTKIALEAICISCMVKFIPACKPLIYPNIFSMQNLYVYTHPSTINLCIVYVSICLSTYLISTQLLSVIYEFTISPLSTTYKLTGFTYISLTYLRTWPLLIITFNLLILFFLHSLFPISFYHVFTTFLFLFYFF